MTKAEFKIIADHLRSSSFLIADGIMPSNEGRGYVLRRIMRRAMRQIHKLGAKQATMHKLVDALIKEMGGAYPELSRAREVIIETLKNEEEKFRETLEKGLKILEEEILRNKNAKFSGVTAFKLYDTYGFPLDLTQDILKEKNLEVNIEEFNSEMESQRERARKNWVGSGEEKDDDLFFKLKEEFGETKFLGYETLNSKAKILAILEKPKAIILNQTPFYATSGGQKGDDGIIKGKNGETKISEVKKFAGNLFVHLIEEIKGEFKISDEVEALVNKKTREARAKNHSATHLLHKALKEVLGNTISQKGSNVDDEYFTFDFNFNRAMNADEVAKVENLVNAQIKLNNSVETNLMSLEKARETGAEALFGEKYDSEVRVVKMGSSIELCGGTHAKNTGEIEILKIISEKGIAAGIRRIEARTSDEAKKYLFEQEENLKNLVKDLIEKNNKKSQEIFALSGVKLSDISIISHGNEMDPVMRRGDKGGEVNLLETTTQSSITSTLPSLAITPSSLTVTPSHDGVHLATIEDLEKLAEILQQELKKKDKEIEKLKKQTLLSNLDNIKIEEVGELKLVSHIFNDIDAKDLREITTDIKNKPQFKNLHVFALFATKDDKVSAIVALSNDLLEKFDSAKLITPVIETIGGKGGGGKKDLAMGGGVKKDSILQAVEVLKISLR